MCVGDEMLKRIHAAGYDCWFCQRGRHPARAWRRLDTKRDRRVHGRDVEEGPFADLFEIEMKITNRLSKADRGDDLVLEFSEMLVAEVELLQRQCARICTLVHSQNYFSVESQKPDRHIA